MARKTKSPEERFFSKISFNGPSLRGLTPCWIWTGAKLPPGYGRFYVDGKVVYAHRYSYGLLVGSISGDQNVDHICFNKSCVNPAHLEAVTPGENTNRYLRAYGHHNSRKIICKHGHAFDHVNGAGSRVCKTCNRNSARASDRRKPQGRR